MSPLCYQRVTTLLPYLTTDKGGSTLEKAEEKGGMEQDSFAVFGGHKVVTPYIRCIVD